MPRIPACFQEFSLAASYSTVNATYQDALQTSTDVNDTMLPGVIGPPPNIRYTVDPYQTRFFGTHWCGPSGGGCADQCARRSL